MKIRIFQASLFIPYSIKCQCVSSSEVNELNFKKCSNYFFKDLFINFIVRFKHNFCLTFLLKNNCLISLENKNLNEVSKYLR